jgi:uncharacterized protein (DUF58 family)
MSGQMSMPMALESGNRGRLAPGGLLRRRWARGLLRRVPRNKTGAHRIGARGIYILPTKTGVLYGMVSAVMLLGSLNYQNNLALLFTFLMVSIGVVAMHHCWLDLLDLAVQVRPPREVFAGATARLDLTLINERGRPRYDLGVAADSRRVAVGPIPGLGEGRVGVGVAAEKRGELVVDELVVDSRHPMHLFRAWCLLSCQARILVYPRPAQWSQAAVVFAGDEQHTLGSGGEGSDDFEGPREYRHGDSPRRIDWKAMARQRGLVTKQFSAEQGSETWIDWSGLTTPDPELRLSILTRQVIEVSADNRRFGLRLPGIELGPSSGEGHVNRCLRELALFHVPDA